MKRNETTINNGNENKKLSKIKFQKLYDNFNTWEKRKNEKIEKMKKKKEEEELKLLKNPKINKDEKFNINPKNYDIIERLYVQDIKKRKDNKEILIKIYTPTFKPEIYTKRYYSNIILQKSRNKSSYPESFTHRYNYEYNDIEEINDEDREEEEYYVNKTSNISRKFIKEKKNYYDEDEFNKKKRSINTSKKNKSQKRRRIKTNVEFEFEEEIKSPKKKSKKSKIKKNNKNDNQNEVKIQLKLRDLLFKNKKPLIRKKNKSVDNRKVKAFTLD